MTATPPDPGRLDEARLLHIVHSTTQLPDERVLMARELLALREAARAPRSPAPDAAAVDAAIDAHAAAAILLGWAESGGGNVAAAKARVAEARAALSALIAGPERCDLTAALLALVEVADPEGYVDLSLHVEEDSGSRLLCVWAGTHSGCGLCSYVDVTALDELPSVVQHLAKAVSIARGLVGQPAQPPAAGSEAVQTFRDAARDCTGEMFGEQAAVKPPAAPQGSREAEIEAWDRHLDLVEHSNNIDLSYVRNEALRLMRSPAPSGRAEALEALAAIEHEQWMAWAKSLILSEVLIAERVERWQRLFVPYAELSEEAKERDRIWARKVLAALDAAQAQAQEGR